MSSARKVILKEDVVFGTGGGSDLHCDVFIPPDTTAPARGLLLVHGGAWVVGDKSQLRGYGFLLGREGTVCVASEYRLAKNSQWPAQIHDVKAAIRWMRANADELGIDPERIAVCGASSGAHLALMAAGSGDRPELEGSGGNAAASSRVAAAVSFYGPTELEPGGEMLKDSVAQLLGTDPGPEVFKQASPVTYVTAGYPPTMLMHSNQDELVPREQSVAFAEALNRLGVPVELHLFDNVPHMFDGSKRLGRQAAYMVNSFLQRYLPDLESEE
ncbi:MAG: alpha/beta hydrolase fold domain-containing protein [Pseudomonadales bacterium]